MSDLSTNEKSGTEAPDDDSAWASVNTPLPVDALMEFCADTERLFRINPMLIFKKWEQTSENNYLFEGTNSSQDPAFDFELRFTVVRLENGFQINYENGIKSSTTLKIEPSELGSKLTITDRYDRLPENERESHLHEVDRSIAIWAEYLQKFCISWKSWSRFGVWRWYMRRIWQPMKPSARRITYMLWWITLIEVALIGLGAGIYFSEFVFGPPKPVI